MSEVRGQPRTARRGAAIVLLALLAPQGTLLVLRTEPSLDLLVRSATVHLVVVSAISACALAVAMDAFLALMAERGHRPGPGESDPAGATDVAAQACHDDQLVGETPTAGAWS